MSRTYKDTWQYAKQKANEINTVSRCIKFGPTSDYKRLRRKIRRAKTKDALRNNKPLPQFKSNDEWDWW